MSKAEREKKVFPARQKLTVVVGRMDFEKINETYLHSGYLFEDTTDKEMKVPLQRMDTPSLRCHKGHFRIDVCI